MTKGLRKYFPALDTVGPLRYKDSWILKKKNLIYQRFFQSKFFPQYDISSLKYFSKQVSEKIQGKKIDVIFSIHPDPIAFFQTDKPVIFTSDATFASLLRLYPALRNLSRESVRNGHLLFQRAIDKCALAIFPSEWAAESARQDYGTDPRKVHVIPYGANIDNDRNRDDIMKLIESRSKNVCKLLFIGVDWKRKRGDAAVRIAVELNRRGLKTELYIVGCHPPSGEKLPDFVKKLGYIDKKSKAGGEQLRKLFEESHFFVLPSQAECFGIVFCEANSFGMPCIATNIGGIPTIFKDNLNGKLFPVENMVEGATQYILQIFPRFDHYQELCLSSFEEYKNRLNWDTFSEKTRELITTVL
ncbi:MAG: glycosyltransferase family 4 protein [Candidatus Omnitrophica bacterium]|nr:glycosyltransferase family 4 protein [Candidatus Omnitrophota bacterium]